MALVRCGKTGSVELYQAEWCPHSHNVRQRLTELGIDFMARQFASKLSESLGHQFVVDNRTGAGATIGTAIAAKATPDGYTLVVSSISTAFNATLYKNLPYDTLKDLASVSLLATSPNVMVVHAANGPKSVADLIRPQVQRGHDPRWPPDF